MELKDTCTLLLSKSTQKVKCHKFVCSELNRELAIHEDADNKEHSSVTDVITGLRLFELSIPIRNIKEVDVKERLEKFIKHYSLESIMDKFKEEDQTSMKEKLNTRKKK